MKFPKSWRLGVSVGLATGLLTMLVSTVFAPFRFVGQAAFEINWDLAPVLSVDEKKTAEDRRKIENEVIAALNAPWPDDEISQFRQAATSSGKADSFAMPAVQITPVKKSSDITHIRLKVDHADPSIARDLTAFALRVSLDTVQSKLRSRGAGSSVSNILTSNALDERRHELVRERIKLEETSRYSPEVRRRLAEIREEQNRLEFVKLENGLKLLSNSSKTLLGIDLAVIQPPIVVRANRVNYWVGVSCLALVVTVLTAAAITFLARRAFPATPPPLPRAPTGSSASPQPPPQPPPLLK